jgi:hypothetical protein
MPKHQVIPGDPNTVIPAVRELRKGEKVVYHTGFLDSDRGIPNVRIIATEVFERARAGLVLLTQRRLGPPIFKGEVDWRNGVGPGFEYIATGA